MALAHAILIPCRYTTFGRLKPLSSKPIAYSNCIDLGGTKREGVNPNPDFQVLYAFIPQRCRSSRGRISTSHSIEGCAVRAQTCAGAVDTGNRTLRKRGPARMRARHSHCSCRHNLDLNQAGCARAVVIITQLACDRVHRPARPIESSLS